MEREWIAPERLSICCEMLRSVRFGSVAHVRALSSSLRLVPEADMALLYAIHSNSGGLGASIDELFT
jgi:hypothetical protein